METAAETAKRPHSILFVKPDSAGDLILFASLLRWLRQHWPKTRIGLLLRSRYRDVVPLLPHGITPLFTSANPYRELVADPSSRESLIRVVKEFAPDVLVAASYDKNWVHCLAAAAVPAVRRISLGPVRLDAMTEHHLRQDGIRPPDGFFPEMVEVSRDAPELEKFGLLAAHLCGVIAPVLSPWINLRDAALAEAKVWLAANGLTAKNFIVCNPAGTANVAIKGWSPASYAEIIDWLQTERGLPILVCAHQDEKALVDRVLRDVGSSTQPRVWLGRDGQLPMMAALAALASAYLGADTSTLHAAEAAGTPVAGIFGGGTWPRFRPAGRRSIAIVHPLPCFGCGWDCHFGDAPCVKLIKTRDVIGILGSWLLATDPKSQPSRTIELAHLPPSYLQDLKRSREIYDRLHDGYAARHVQIIELTALARRQENDIVAVNVAAAQLQAEARAQQAQLTAASRASAQRAQELAEESGSRHVQILELTQLVHQHADESAARQQQILELTALARHHEEESAARYAQILELTALVHHHEDESAARQEEILELTALIRRHEGESAARHAQILELATLLQQRADENAVHREQFLELTALARGHEEESAARQKQILELTALVQQREDESAARQAQILELTALVHRHEGESAARQQQILELTALARCREEESAARHAQIVELTTLVERCTGENAVGQGQTLELTALVQELERESTSRHAQIIELTALVQQRSEESAARQQQILELTALVHHHESESAVRHGQVLELSQLVEQRTGENAVYQRQILELAALVHQHEDESASRYAQILELTALARYHEGESAARHGQILELTTLAQQRADDHAARQAAILELTALVHHHETESAARHAQVAELTELAQRQSRQVADLKDATAALQREIASVRAEAQIRDEAAQTQQRVFVAEKAELSRQIGELEVDRQKFERILQAISEDLAGRTNELAALRQNRWVRLGRRIHLIAAPPSP